MANGMGTLYIGASGLRNSQNALNTTANNLANVDTEGYVRQQVYFSDKEYTTFANAAVSKQQAGYGLNIGDVIHARDIFIDKAYRSECGRQAFYETCFTAVDEVQTYYQEMEGKTFQSAMEDFWKSFQEYSKDPSDSVNQDLIVQKAGLFLTRAQSVYAGLKSYQANINVQISNDIDQINKLGHKIQELNQQIAKIEIGGQETAMNLRDERDLALDQLGTLAKISYKENAQGVVTVKVENEYFVDGVHVYEMGKEVDQKTGFITPYWPYLSDLDKGQYDYVYDFNIDISSALNSDIGELKALIMCRGDHWADYSDIEGMGAQEYLDSTNMSVMLDMQAKLDQMMHSIMTSINDLFCPNIQGPAGVTYQDANGNTIDLNSVRVLDTENCAVGSDKELPPRELFTRSGTERYTKVTGSDGNTYYVYNEEDTSDTSMMYSLTSCDINEALKKVETLIPHLKQNGEVDRELGTALVEIWEKNMVGLDPTDPEPVNFKLYYQKMIDGLATIGNVYNKTAESLAGSVLTIDTNRQQVIGVSSDEELTNMIKYQNAYNASSRFMTVISEMIEHIITRLGG
ncbi:MAG: flagellar hook-associated protein FlgK [Lachnospiraceae bacterium]|nr:flagellar hook-associated protein FlgK [Lachnospiraceae bacterium]